MFAVMSIMKFRIVSPCSLSKIDRAGSRHHLRVVQTRQQGLCGIISFIHWSCWTYWENGRKNVCRQRRMTSSMVAVSSLLPPTMSIILVPWVLTLLFALNSAQACIFDMSGLEKQLLRPLKCPRKRGANENTMYLHIPVILTWKESWKFCAISWCDTYYRASASDWFAKS